MTVGLKSSPEDRHLKRFALPTQATSSERWAAEPEGSRCARAITNKRYQRPARLPEATRQIPIALNATYRSWVEGAVCIRLARRNGFFTDRIS